MLRLLIIVVCSLAMIGIGLGARKKVRTESGFFVAQRQMSLPFITGSLVGTAVGGSVTVGMAGLGFGRGLTGAWWLLVGSIGLLVLGFFFARKVRGAALYTLPELVGKQYGGVVGLAASILIVIAWTGVVAGQIVAAGKVLSILGMGSVTVWMLIFSLVVILYSVLGGQFSIIRTDFIQAVILFLGIFLASGLALSSAGGLDGLKASLPSGYFSFPVSPVFSWKMLLSFLILVGATYVVGPDMYTRLFCAKDEGTARRSTFLTAALFIPLAFAVVFVGMSAKILYPQIPSEQAFPQVISGVLSPALSGLILAALIAALMSTAATCLLSQSVILTEDVFKRFRPSIDERRIVLLTRVSLVGLGLLALAVALASKGVIASLLFAYTIFTCGLVVPVIAGFYKERLKVTWQGALAAMICGGAIGLIGKIPIVDVPFKEDLGLIGFAVSAILLFVVSYFTRKKILCHCEEPVS